MRIGSSILLSLLFVTACDTSKKKEGPSEEEAKAAAEQAETDKRIEERRKAREAEDAAKKKAEEDRNTMIKEELCVVPEDAKPPKKLDDACNAMADAQIDFLRRQYASDPDKLAGVEKNAAMQKANIIKMCASMEIALGLKNAFDKAPEGYGEYMNDIVSVCMQQLAGGPPPAGAAAVPAKRPG